MNDPLNTPWGISHTNDKGCSSKLKELRIPAQIYIYIYIYIFHPYWQQRKDREGEKVHRVTQSEISVTRSSVLSI